MTLKAGTRWSSGNGSTRLSRIVCGPSSLTLLAAALARGGSAYGPGRGRGRFDRLPRDEKLDNGAVLPTDDDRALMVRIDIRHRLPLQPARSPIGVELGYHAGNSEWRVRCQGDALLVALKGPVDGLPRPARPIEDTARRRLRPVRSMANKTCVRTDRSVHGSGTPLSPAKPSLVPLSGSCYGPCQPTTDIESPICGEVAEWLNAPHSKCGMGASPSGVQIPPSPPTPSAS